MPKTSTTILLLSLVIGVQSYYVGSSFAAPYDDPYFDYVGNDPLEVKFDLPSGYHGAGTGPPDIKAGVLAPQSDLSIIQLSREYGLNASSSTQAAQDFVSTFKPQDEDVKQTLGGTENITNGGNQSTIVQYTRYFTDGDVLSRNAISYFVVGENVYSLYLKSVGDQAIYDKQFADYKNIIKSLEFITNKSSN